jgi:serine/threonine protein kinase
LERTRQCRCKAIKKFIRRRPIFKRGPRYGVTFKKIFHPFFRKIPFHQNVVKFVGIAQDKEKVRYLITEFVHRGDLRTLIRNKHIELTEKSRIKLLMDIANGMNHLHMNSVLHRYVPWA